MNFVLEENVDIKDYQNLHSLVGWKILPDCQVRKSLKNSMFVVKAKANGQTIGMARVVGDFALHGLLCDVIVCPNFQRNGIGKAMVQWLMSKCQQFADKNGDFLLELLPTANNAQFYVRCGFKHKPKNMDGCYCGLKQKHKRRLYGTIFFTC